MVLVVFMVFIKRYISASRGGGVPFVSPMVFYRFPNLSPAMAAAAVYGSIGGGLAIYGGKRI